MRLLLPCVLTFSLFVVGGVSVAAKPDDGKKPKPTPAERFKKLDADNSGTLTASEFLGKRVGDKAEAAKKAFQFKDKNNDGLLALDEFRTSVNPKPKANAKPKARPKAKPKVRPKAKAKPKAKPKANPKAKGKRKKKA